MMVSTLSERQLLTFQRNGDLESRGAEARKRIVPGSPVTSFVEAASDGVEQPQQVVPVGVVAVHLRGRPRYRVGVDPPLLKRDLL